MVDRIVMASFASQVLDWPNENLGGHRREKPWLPCCWLRAPLPHSRHRSAPGRFLLRTLGNLVEICRVGSARPHYLEAVGYCNGYGRSALDYHRAIVPPDAPPLFCAPAGTEPGTLRARFVAWADANPVRLSGPAVEGVFAFLAASFPCPTRRR
jgi:hypothetical protein